MGHHCMLSRTHLRTVHALVQHTIREDAAGRVICNQGAGKCIEICRVFTSEQLALQLGLVICLQTIFLGEWSDQRSYVMSYHKVQAKRL